MSYVNSNLSTSSTPAMSLASPSTTSPSAARRLRTKTSDITDLLRRSHSHRDSHPPLLPTASTELAKEPGARSKRRIPLFGLKRKSAGTIKDASASASESESTTKAKDWRKLKRLSAGASFQPTASSSSSPRPPLPVGRHSSSTTLSPNSSLPPLNVPTPSFSPISQFTRSPTSSPSVHPSNGAGRSTTPTPSSVAQRSVTTSHHRDRHRGSASGQDRENATPTGSPTKPDFPLQLPQQCRDSDRNTPTPTATSTSASASNSASNSVSTSASSLPSPVSVMSSSAFFIPLPPSSAAKLREREREQQRERPRPTITISPAPAPTAAELAEEEKMYVSPREAPVPTAVSTTMHQRSSSIVRSSGEASIISGQRNSAERVRPAPPSNSALPHSHSRSRIASPSSSQVRSDGELSTGSGTSTSMFSGRGRRPTYHSHRLHARTPSASTSATSATGSSRDELERVFDFRSSASENERELDRGRRKLALSTPGKGRLPMSTGAQPRSPSTTPSPSPTPTATPQRHVRKPMPTPAQLIRERAVEAFEAESAKNTKVGSGNEHARSESNNSAELEAVLELGAPFEKSEDEEKDTRQVLTPTRGRSGSTSTNASTSSVRSSSSRLRTTSARPSQLSNMHAPSTLDPSGTRSATASPILTPSLRSRTISAASSMNSSLKARLRESLSPPASPSQSPIPNGARIRASPTSLSPSRMANLAAASPPPQKPLPVIPSDSMRSVRSISTSSASGSSLSAQTLVSMPSSISTAPSSSSTSSGTLVTPSGSNPDSISGLPTIPSLASLPVPQDKNRARTHSTPLKSIDERTGKNKDADSDKSAPDTLQAALARNAELEAENVALLARIDVLERAARRRDREISGLRYLVVNGHVQSGEESSPEQASTPGEKKDSPPTRTHRAHTVPGPSVNTCPRTRNAEDVGSKGLGIVVDESAALDAIPEAENQEARLRPPNGAPAPEANRDSASSSSVLSGSSSSQSGLGTEKEGTDERRREKEERRASKALRRISAAGALPVARASSEAAGAQYAQNLARDRTPSIAQVIERERASSEREVGMEEMLKRLRAFAGKAERR